MDLASGLDHCGHLQATLQPWALVESRVVFCHRGTLRVQGKGMLLRTFLAVVSKEEGLMVWYWGMPRVLRRELRAWHQ